MGNVLKCVVCGRDMPNVNPARKYCERCKGKGAFIRREARYAHASPAIMRQKRKAVQDAKSERRNGPSDKYLTWRSIWEANRGRCYLCGKPCDPRDCTWKNGGFVTGWRYPTLDHMVPIMKGGKHEADNVRLAHKWCNTIKHDHTVEEVLSPDWDRAFSEMPKKRTGGGDPCPGIRRG